MGIFDIFTNDSAKEAAAKNAELYRQYGQQATGALGQYGTTANDIFTRLGSTADRYLTDANGQAIGATERAYAPVTALGQKYGGATGLYLDALGVNGPEGAARAKAAFTTGPGYNFAVDEATKAAANKAASLGIAGSGNTLDEIRNRAQGFANQEYGNYLTRLGGFVAPELSATTAAAGGLGSEAGLYSGLGSARAGLASNVAGGQAGVAHDLATGQIGIAGNVTGGLAGANNAEAQAAQQGSANFWNLLASLGGSAARAYAGGGAGARA